MTNYLDLSGNTISGQEALLQQSAGHIVRDLNGNPVTLYEGSIVEAHEDTISTDATGDIIEPIEVAPNTEVENLEAQEPAINAQAATLEHEINTLPE